MSMFVTIIISEKYNRLQTNYNQTIHQICRAVKQLTQIFRYEVETIWIQREKTLRDSQTQEINYNKKTTNYKNLTITKPLQFPLS